MLKGTSRLDLTPMPFKESRADEMFWEFCAFHAENAAVWDIFCQYARVIWHERDYKTYSVNAIFEVIRWHSHIPGLRGEDNFKVNNNHHAFYAREYMAQFPQYGNFFRIRRQKSKDQPATHLDPLGPSAFPYEN